MQFTTKSRPKINLDILDMLTELISETYDAKFLGIYADSTLSWKIHIEQITDKLGTAFMSQETLKMVY
jgi:hypothetical protein